MAYKKEYYDKNKDIFKKAQQKWYYGHHEKAKKMLRCRSKMRTLALKEKRKELYRDLYIKALETENCMEKLVFLRKSLGKTQMEMANLLNITQPAYYKYENGKIRQSRLMEILSFLEKKFNKRRKK